MKRILMLVVLASLVHCACSGELPSSVSSTPFVAETQTLVRADSSRTVATSLRFYWTVGGVTVQLSQLYGAVLLPLDAVGTLRVEALDAAGQIVPLSDPTWSGSGTWFSIVGVRQIATITPIAVGPYDPVLLNADADSGPEVVPIWGVVQVRVVESTR